LILQPFSLDCRSEVCGPSISRSADHPRLRTSGPWTLSVRKILEYPGPRTIPRPQLCFKYQLRQWKRTRNMHNANLFRVYTSAYRRSIL